MIVKMSKISLLGVEDQREALIKSLMDFGAVEICTVDDKDYEDIAKNPAIQEEVSLLESDLAKVNTALESLAKYCPEKKGFFQNRRSVTISEFEKIINDRHSIWNAVDKIREQEEHLISLRADENRLNNLHQSLLPWKGLTAPLEASGTHKTVFQYGTIPSLVSWDSIESEFDEKATCSIIKRIDTDRDQHYVYVLTHSEAEQECLSFLKSRGYNRVTFPGLTGTVTENIKKIESRLKELSSEREACGEQVMKMAENRRSIEVLHDALMMEKGRVEAAGKVLTTKRAFYIKGWIPEKYAMDAKKSLESTYTVSVEIEEPGEEEEFPVLLENKGIAEAGEPVSGMYSLPNSREIDPNAVMAPFFILFFGLMLGDGGYGLIMAIITGIVLWRFQLDDGTRKFVKLMFFCGLSTVFWGAMFGGWFGITALVPYAVWFDMVAEPEKNAELCASFWGHSHVCRLRIKGCQSDPSEEISRCPV